MKRNRQYNAPLTDCSKQSLSPVACWTLEGVSGSLMPFADANGTGVADTDCPMDGLKSFEGVWLLSELSLRSELATDAVVKGSFTRCALPPGLPYVLNPETRMLRIQSGTSTAVTFFMPHFTAPHATMDPIPSKCKVLPPSPARTLRDPRAERLAKLSCRSRSPPNTYGPYCSDRLLERKSGIRLSLPHGRRLLRIGSRSRHAMSRSKLRRSFTVNVPSAPIHLEGRERKEEEDEEDEEDEEHDDGEEDDEDDDDDDDEDARLLRPSSYELRRLAYSPSEVESSAALSRPES